MTCQSCPSVASWTCLMDTARGEVYYHATLVAKECREQRWICPHQHIDRWEAMTCARAYLAATEGTR